MSVLLSGLELLTAVVETGSFVRAGERVGLSQSGVSRAVARLEAQVGARLFDRNARAVTLTDEGRRFHERVAPLLSALEEAVDVTSRSAGRVHGRLRVNVDPFFARTVLAPHLDAFLREHPDLSVEIVVRDHADNFIAEGFDAAVRFGDPTEAGLVMQRLYQTRIVTSASPAYLARRGRPKHPRDLAKGHECIQFRDWRTARPFEWEFHRKGRRILKVPVTGRLLLNDGDTAVNACVAGHGVAQFMEIGTAHLFDEGKLVDLFPEWGDELFPLCVLLPSKRLPPAKVRAFLDFVSETTKSARARRRPRS